MPGLNYEPDFHFDPWADGVDRVAAAGDNGFNARFAALEAEFARIADAPLAPVRASSLDIITGATVTRTIGSGVTEEINGAVVTAASPQLMFPLLSVSTSTPNGQFSVTTAYKAASNAQQLTVVYLVVNTSDFTITVSVTPCLVRI